MIEIQLMAVHFILLKADGQQGSVGIGQIRVRGCVMLFPTIKKQDVSHTFVECQLVLII